NFKKFINYMYTSTSKSINELNPMLISLHIESEETFRVYRKIENNYTRYYSNKVPSSIVPEMLFNIEMLRLDIYYWKSVRDRYVVDDFHYHDLVETIMENDIQISLDDLRAAFTYLSNKSQLITIADIMLVLKHSILRTILDVIPININDLDQLIKNNNIGQKTEIEFTSENQDLLENLYYFGHTYKYDELTTALEYAKDNLDELIYRRDYVLYSPDLTHLREFNDSCELDSAIEITRQLVIRLVKLKTKCIK
ncbi:MAG: hypothetical protein WA253_07425, partial [Gammaproteobacteria bacterium]